MTSAALPEIEGYADLTEVGRGGFAVVYRARQERIGRLVALKVLTAVQLDGRARTRFARECQAMGELSWHPHVVAVHDSGTAADGRPWLAMEYLERGSLGDRVATYGPVPWAEAVTAGIEVAGALGAAHAHGTLHRDVKPENMLVGPFGETKLADFGIAAVEGAAKTTTGRAWFSVAHVAPEVLRGQRQDERTDVYCLASSVLTLVKGGAPFAGDPDEPLAATMMRVLDTEPELPPELPGPLAEVLAEALAKDPDARPQSAAELGTRLQQVQADAGLPVRDLLLTPSTPAPAGRLTDGDEAPTRDHRPTGPARSAADPHETRSVAAPPSSTGVPSAPSPSSPPTLSRPVAPPPPPPDAVAPPAHPATVAPDPLPPAPATPAATPGVGRVVSTAALTALVAVGATLVLGQLLGLESSVVLGRGPETQRLLAALGFGAAVGAAALGLPERRRGSLPRGAVAGALAGVVMQVVGYEVLDSLYYDALPAAVNQVGSAQEAATYGALFWAAFAALLGAAALIPIGGRAAGGARRVGALALAGAVGGALSGLLLVWDDLGATLAGALVESLVVGAALGLAAAATTPVSGDRPAPAPPH